MSYLLELQNTNLSIKEEVVQILDELSEIELKQVIEYVSFLKFRLRIKAISPAPEVSQLAKLYAEFAEEDRQLAEEGMEDYTASLVKEDTK
ncbi:MAG: hypothetical protein DRR08_13650 [Candidatus Parabeggiatoa sp. nov. 2]|nr:MAG: hypothetical protein B6247_29480 [Beggiatoa sp. 4572_84]RKZ59559.1 MAG: hypothetical protein DRR08_13650 [Gammaproteobacteria bacterium]